MASTSRQDLTWYEKNRGNEYQIKTAEFRSAKRIEEEALMAALGLKMMPPPANPTTSTQSKPVIKREPESRSIKNEPMTPAIHHDSRNSKRHEKNKKYDSQRKEDRRRRRQLQATGSDEEKHDWSENDEEDLMDQDYNNDNDNKMKQSIQQNILTEKELDEFLVDLVKKHGLKTIQRVLKSKKDKKEHKRKRSSSSSSSSAASESEEEKKHKHKKKHSHKEESKSTKRHRSHSSSPSSKKDRSKHHRNR